MSSIPQVHKVLHLGAHVKNLFDAHVQAIPSDQRSGFLLPVEATLVIAWGAQRRDGLRLALLDGLDTLSPAMRTSTYFAPRLLGFFEASLDGDVQLVNGENFEMWTNQNGTWVVVKATGGRIALPFRVGYYAPPGGKGPKVPRFYVKLSALRAVPGLMADLEVSGLFAGLKSKDANVFRYRVVCALAGEWLPYERTGRKARGRGNSANDFKGSKFIVHHLNENTVDDRWENLEVMTEAKHNQLHNKASALISHSTLEAGNVGDVEAAVSAPLTPSNSWGEETTYSPPAEANNSVNRCQERSLAYEPFVPYDDDWSLGEPRKVASDEILLDWAYYFQHTRPRGQVRVLARFADMFMDDPDAWNDPAARKESASWKRLQELCPNWHHFAPAERHAVQRRLRVGSKQGVVWFINDQFGFVEMPFMSAPKEAARNHMRRAGRNPMSKRSAGLMASV